jgi:hypothetical protein
MSIRFRGRLMRVAITAGAGLAVLAGGIIQPLTSASAQPLAHAAAPPSAATRSPGAPPGATYQKMSKAAAAKVNRSVLARAAATEKVISYRVSPAVIAVLDSLGMRLGSTTLMSGLRSGSSGQDVRISLPPPDGLPLGLPAGAHQPRYGRSVLVVNRVTGAATLTSGSADETLRVTIPGAAALAASARLDGYLSVRVPVLGQTASLSGTVSYSGGHSSVALSGHLPGRVDLQRGVAELRPGAKVTLGTVHGLHVDASALLGPVGRQLGVPVSGAPVSQGGWTFTVRGGPVLASPLPGLALAPTATGTIASRDGVASYHVTVPTARPWTPVNGVSASGSAVFSNALPGSSLLPAAGVAPRVPWIDVTGTVTVASAQAGPVTAHGTVAVNLASGKGALDATSTAPVTLTGGPRGQVLDQAGFRGTLSLGTHGLTASVRGDGMVTLAGTRRTVAFRTSLSVSPSGALVVPVPAAATRLAAIPTLRAVAARATTPAATSKAASTAADAGGSYTLSGPVNSFLTQTLHIPLGSATLTGTLSGQTLTLTAAGPTALPSSLPSWMPSPSYASTQLSVDESTGTLTLTATTATTAGYAATLAVTIARAGTSDLSDGTDVTGTLTLDGLPFAGNATASLAFTLGYGGGALTASLAGQTTGDASFANGEVTIGSGATLTLATGSGLSISGTAGISTGTQGAAPLEVDVTGTFSGPQDWNLTVSNSNAPAWQPGDGLSVTPDFTGSVTDASGTIGFDLQSAGAGPVAQWSSGGSSPAASVAVSSVEVSNQAPPASATTCTTARQVKDGDLWVGLSGQFSYAFQAPLPALTIPATGCFDLTGQSATVTATGDLTGEFGTSLPFRVDAATLTASLSGGTSGTFSVTGGATVEVTAVSGDPSFGVALSLSKASIIAGAMLDASDASRLNITGSGALYVATAATAGFNPQATFGFGTQPASINLPAGVAVDLSAALPSPVTSALRNIIPSFPATTFQTMGTLSSSGFSLDASVSLGSTGSGTGGALVASNSSSGVAFYLDRVGVGFQAAAGQVKVSLTGTGYLVLPNLVTDSSTTSNPTGTAGSAVTVNVGGSFNAATTTLSLAFSVAGVWNNALGIPNLTIANFGGNFGLTLGSGIPTPSLGLSGSGITLPSQWGSLLGIVNGAAIWFNGQLNLAQPVIGFGIYNPYGGPALYPLSIDPYAPQATVDSFQVSSASFELAPFGGTSPAGDTLSPGGEVQFQANVDNVPVWVNATVDLDPQNPQVYAAAYVGAFTLGRVQVRDTYFYLLVTPASYGMDLEGGFSYGGVSFYADMYLALSTSVDGAGMSVFVTGGLPSLVAKTLQGGLYVFMTGSVSGDYTGAQVYAAGTAWLTAGGTAVGPVLFQLRFSTGLQWSDPAQDYAGLAKVFWQAGGGFNDIVSLLEQFGASAAVAAVFALEAIQGRL